MGHFKHVIRRNVPMTYIIENNGCYGLTKGQFSATSDQGLRLKTSGCEYASSAGYVYGSADQRGNLRSRAYSGDAKQLKELVNSGTFPNVGLQLSM